RGELGRVAKSAAQVVLGGGETGADAAPAALAGVLEQEIAEVIEVAVAGRPSRSRLQLDEARGVDLGGEPRPGPGRSGVAQILAALVAALRAAQAAEVVEHLQAEPDLAA